MTMSALKPALASLISAVACLTAWQVLAGSELVQFPHRYAEGIHYATVTRGDVREELFTSAEAIAVARSGQPFPSGTVITMEDYRGDKLFRYVVLEKRTGWGAQYPPDKRNGEWEFQEFRPDRSVNAAASLDRCFACHKSKAADDFVFTRERMRIAP